MSAEREALADFIGALRQTDAGLWPAGVTATDLMGQAATELEEARAEIDALRNAQHIGMELSNHHAAALCPYCARDRGNDQLRAQADALEGLALTLAAVLPPLDAVTVALVTKASDEAWAAVRPMRAWN